MLLFNIIQKSHTHAYILYTYIYICCNKHLPGLHALSIGIFGVSTITYGNARLEFSQGKHTSVAQPRI